jgi:2-keto-4-pentenoate hydratase/2-oxohepta-3-ene-1,7-dioic acid hydratase in catechol pathway
MRIATIHGRIALIDGAGSGAVDVETVGGGRFDPEPAGVYERWTEFATWAGSALLPPSESLEPGSLGSPSPNPRQVFAIGLNYSAHAAESGFARPDTSPPVQELIFGVPELIEQLSRVTPLLPGDLIFTGTPQGVGIGRTPPRWIAPGDVLTSYIEGIGEMRHPFMASGPRGRDANSDPEEER